MPTIQVKANFPEGQFGFYQPPKTGQHASPGRRVYNDQVISVYYDNDFPLEDVVKDGKLVKRGQLASWMEPLEAVKKKPGPKAKSEKLIDDDQ